MFAKLRRIHIRYRWVFLLVAVGAVVIGIIGREELVRVLVALGMETVLHHGLAATIEAAE